MSKQYFTDEFKIEAVKQIAFSRHTNCGLKHPIDWLPQMLNSPIQ